MSKNKRPKKSKTSSWRTINQVAAKRSSTPAARRRKLIKGLKVSCLSLLLVAALSFVGYGIYGWATQSGTIHFSLLSQPIQAVEFKTDGVLSKDWVRSKLKLSSQSSLMGLDIFKIKETLESVDQIRSAVVERQFPDTLLITIQEYEPVLRVAVQEPSSEPKVMLVSSEGVVYDGKEYPLITLKRLPYLGGVHLERSNGAFEPLKGMDVVAQLLKKARLQKPHLYADWKIVSCQRFDQREEAVWSVIKIRTSAVGEVVFKPQDFDDQLDKLDYIFRDATENRLRIRRIDLSLGSEAVVQMANRRRGQPYKS
tara:strand:+ start:62555 stop:63487 length:933 start_codon:yes stop_codon:yes gene_type:complete